MIAYAESSAVLSWILGEPGGEAAHQALENAEFVIASDLTLIECDRAFHRAARLGTAQSHEFAEWRQKLTETTADWVVLALDEEIVERARESFPGTPIRTLDALHLSTALATAKQIPETSVVSYDLRVRRCSRDLGLDVQPPDEDDRLKLPR